MRRLCERPGCVGNAEVSYGIDNANLTVWLDNTHVPEREHAGRLCRRHANALVVPRGWTVDDRRQPIPRLFRDAEEATGVAGADRAPDRATTRKAAARPKSKRSSNDSHRSEPIVPAVEAEVEPTLFSVDPDETRALSWSLNSIEGAAGADCDANEEAAEEPDAPVLGRLMGRAFRRSGP